MEIFTLISIVLIVNIILYLKYFYKDRPFILFIGMILLSSIPFINIIIFLYMIGRMDYIIKNKNESKNKKKILCKYNGEIIKIDDKIYHDLLNSNIIKWDNYNKYYSLKDNELLEWDNNKKYYKIIKV